MTWQLQDAKNKLSEVVETSLSKGPQIISRRGKDTAVVISYADYQRFVVPKNGLKKLLLGGPTGQLEVERDDSGRASELNVGELAQ